MCSLTVALQMSTPDVLVETVKTSVILQNHSGHLPLSQGQHNPLCLFRFVVQGHPWLQAPEEGAETQQSARGLCQMWYLLLPCLSGLLSSYLTPSRVFLLQQSWKSKVSTHLTNPAAFIIPIVVLYKNTPHLLSILVFEARGEEGSGGEGPFPGCWPLHPRPKRKLKPPFFLL